MKLAALIVTFNRLEKLKKCWAATAALNFAEIIIVDNASTDSTSEWLYSLIDTRLSVITLPNNIGGAGGFKAGTQYIKNNSKVDWVAFYDDDAYPPENLIRAFKKIENSAFQAYCCKVEDLERNICKMNVPYSTFPKTFIDTIEYVMHPHKYLPNTELSQVVSSFSFVGLIINKQLLDRNINYIYEELFIYYDDLYFAHMLSENGCKIRFCTEIVFLHDIPRSAEGITPEWKVYYLVRNLILAGRLPGNVKIYSIPAVSFRVMKYIVYSIRQKNKLKYLFYIFKGIAHGFFYRTGKQH